MYRISRNIEASVIDWLNEELTSDGWTGIRIEKNFVEAYKGTLPCIVVGVNSIDSSKLEIGSSTWFKTFEVNIRIFATSDGLRLDLSDWLLDELENDIDYNIYTITEGITTDKIISGKIIIKEITRHEKELTNTENLELEDKYRNITTFTCYVAEQGE